MEDRRAERDSVMAPDLAGLREVEAAARLLGRRGVRPRTVRLYACWAVLLFLAFLFVPSLGTAVYAPAIVSTVVAMIAGIVRNRPRRRLPWVLISLGSRLAALIGDRGRVSRLGADEFGVVLPDAVSVEEVEQLASRIVDGLVDARLRVGVATSVDAAAGAELISRADVALDSSRGAGEPRWRRYDAALHAQVLDEMRLRADLSRALAVNEFLLNYQPIVDLATGRTAGFEALARWPHPTRGMVSPVVFIPLAEETGLIVELGAWVLHTAVHEAASWPGQPYVSVNVSVRQFHSPGFVERVHAELASSGLPPERLTLEITESLLLGKQDRSEADIARLRSAGIKVSIDDFGTGYSSLSYLYRMPVDVLKLDKSFVDEITTSAQQHGLVRGILQMASTLGLAVVAEGIETEPQRALLAEAGCDYGQGFLFARPLSAEDARALIGAQDRPAAD